MPTLNTEWLRSQSNETMESRFWSKVSRTDTCWIWTGKTDHGYGAIRIAGKGSKTIRAHRVSWIISGKDIPEGMFLLHHCDVKGCVNPDHLFIGTTLDNMRDKVNKGRSAKGEQHGRHKLRENDVLAIRRLWQSGASTMNSIAKLFSVHPSTAMDAATGQSWKHIP